MITLKSERAHGANFPLRLLSGVSAGALLFAGSLVGTAHAQDADRNWDANSTAVGNGGSGTWDLSSPTWSPGDDGVSGPYDTPWDNTLLDNAIFGGTAGTVTLGEPITVHDMSFNVHNYTLTGGTLTLAGATPTIDTAGNTTINSVIAGTDGLVKTGSRLLYLTGVNTFSGGIALNDGFLHADSDAALGDLSNNIEVNGNVELRIDSGISNRTVTVASGARVSLSGASTGTALYTGAGDVDVHNGVRMTNDASSYTGATRMFGANGGSGLLYFSSVRNLGEASSLGAPTTVADGTIYFTGGNQYSDRIAYNGTGDTTNRNWVMSGGTLRRFLNVGSGTLSITGDIEMASASRFEAVSAGFDLSGVLSGASPSVIFRASAGAEISLGGANSYTGLTDILGGVVKASVLANSGAASSLGVNANVNLGNNGILTYVGTGDTSDRIWSVNGRAGIHNEGTGALALTGDLSFDPANPWMDSISFGGNYAGQNSFSGVISGEGDLISTGSSVWELNAANSREGAIIMNGGTLRAGNADAFGIVTGITVNGGTLDAGSFDLETPTLAGSGGTIALNGSTLTVNAATAQTYGGAIAGTGGLTKLGAGTLSLTGVNSYTGTTNVGGGKLAIDFSSAGGPVDNIVSSLSQLTLSGGKIEVIGAAGEVNNQSFNGTVISAGSNIIQAVSGGGGTTNLYLGALSRVGGLANFVVPANGAIRTTNPDGALGGWATINGSDYAKVLSGGIIAFDASDYTDKDDAGNWLNGEIISDAGGPADSPFMGTVNGNVQLGGLRYTAAAPSTVTVGGGNTLGVDGTIIVAPSVLANNQTITGGSLTGGAGGGALGIQQNGTGTFTIQSAIVDNGGATSFVKGGSGRTVLSGTNSYSGVTNLTNGVLSVSNIGDGGISSGIGASSAASANLILEGGTLQYTGATATTDRGFTLVNGGVTRAIEVTNSASNLVFTGLVTSPDDAGFTKSGAGTLTLGNAANDYIGVTTVSGGTLAVDTLTNGGMTSNIGMASSDSENIVLEGGTLSYTGTTTSTDRGMTFGPGGGGVGVADASASLTLSGILTGTALRKEGAGTLILTGANSYTNGTTVNDGVLRAGAENVFGGGAMDVKSGAQLDLDGFDNNVSTLFGAGNVDLGNAILNVTSGGTFNGSITGSGGLTRSGSNQYSLKLLGCNSSYTGATTLTSYLSVDCLADGGQNSAIGASTSDSSNLIFSNGALIYTGGNVSVDRGFTLQSGNGIIIVDNAATTLQFSGEVVGGGRLRKDGPGTLTLSGNNSYSGSTIIDGGTLRAGTTNVFGTGNISIADAADAVLDLNNFDNIVRALYGGGAAGGNVLLGTATLTLNAPSSGSAAYAGAISGTGGLVKNGAFNQILSGCDSTYTGSTIINSGTLHVACLEDGGVASSMGASGADPSNLILNGGTLRYIGAGNNTDRQFSLGSSATSGIDANGTGAINFTNNAAISYLTPDTNQTLRLGGASTADNTFASQVTNNGSGLTSLTKLDSGTWILTNPNSNYTGVTTISGGVLGVSKLSDGGIASSIGASSAAASNLIIGNGSTLRYTGSGDTTDRLFTLSSGVTFIESSGTGAIVFTDIGPVTLQGNNQARTIALGGTNSGNNTLAGSIGNAGSGVTSLAKNDSGKWVLTGNHSYTGSTNINDGILSIGAGGTTGSISSGIVNNFGALQFNRSNQLVYGGAISGTGTVTQAGTGTTILTGNSNYSGGTTISAGALQLGNGGVTGNIIGDVANNGNLIFNRSDDYQFDGTITGSGSVSQIGNGTTTLTATNGYSGGTIISAGTLRVSSDSNLGASSGGLTINAGSLNTTATMTSSRNVTLTGNGTFLTDPATTLTLGGTISGAGRLTKSGDGTLVLTANNTYSGGTTIGAGTLQIGNGGATGGIIGDVLNNGALLFDRSGSLAMDGVISGSGSVTQSGPGTTIFSGNNSYAGATNVNTGALIVNGDQSGATGLTTVASGAMLGGTGIIGGDVTIANGGILSAGSNGVGTLSINGNLALANTSQLDFEFGQANVPGGPLNDLVNVAGDLTLDGIVNVTQPSGGNFGPGVYRMFNYSGVLTDNGATLGVLPGGSAGFIQTAISNQVNLVNTAGLILNFWDGAGGPKNDGVIQGGNGVWRLANGANDWTEVSGTVNADYAQDSFAIFQGTGGVVSVDNSGGAVLTTGMQFTASDYVITGDTLTLTGTEALVRVGDGSPGDAGIVTRIEAELTGTAGLTKDLGGTLVLTGNNSYAGGTAINGGTLSIVNDSNLGDIAGGLSLDGGTLNNTTSFSSNRAVDLAGTGSFLTDAGTIFTLDGLISGAGALTKDGDGTLVLTNGNSYAGGTTVNAGTLSIGNGGASGSLIGDIVNDGSVAFNRSDDIIFSGIVSGSGSLEKLGGGTLTVTGANSYTGGTTISAGILQLGNGGTSGEIIGDVLNNGTLLFNRSDMLGFAGLISGTGNVTQAGPGTTILLANNSYAGATDVNAGTLLVNGDQSLATGLTTVNSGSALGGTGTIGGNVIIADNAILTPGDATGPGTLTINGNLELSNGTSLTYDFGQSDTVGGPLNDHTQVGGDLTLDGTIDVAVTAGGDFGPGLYRVISYDGTLTDNGLVTGALPPGSLVAVQTSVAGQVNLINASGATLNFWDGANAANKSNGAINGGDGIWQNSAGNDNWTETTGAVNGAYTDGSFAIFAATPGIVSVDNSLGAVSASGMQFASDGYRITGQELTLVGPQAKIRVGDGSALGTGYTATIDATLSGASELVKADLGTLVLTGNNSYTGGTLINVGTLRVSSDANLGDLAGAISFGGGIINTTADMTSDRAINVGSTGRFLTDTGTTLALNGSITGAGGLTKTGAGSLVLNGTNSFAGDTAVDAGSLFVNGDQSGATGLTSVVTGALLGGSGIIGGDVIIADGATLAAGTDGVGTLTVGGDLVLNDGSLMDFEFGEANVAGGLLNDLVNVDGDLVLDGTINVTVPTGGSFGPGIYRAINYGGTITDNGLTLGTLPGGSAVSVQTAINGQVNLVNTAGLTLSFWDGAAGPKNDGTINGGDGVWQIAGGSNNWTDLDGSVNADYMQDSFAVFSAAPGAVTVDNSNGNVLASGMQFASDGYHISGDPLTLTGAQAVVQVGDGSAASSGYVATIDAELVGTAGLEKTDTGTLILAGANSYTGGTAINGGTLRISDDVNLGDVMGGLSFDGGTLSTTASFSSNRSVDLAGAGTFQTDVNTTFDLGGDISGAGSLTKSGSGTLILSGTGSHTGAMNVNAGTVLVNGNYGTASGDVTVLSGAYFGGTGTIGGNVTLADGAILTPGAGGAGTLTIGGNLDLSSGSQLNYEFGAANVVGGALNDLVNVGGNLALDGTIDVTVTAGGAFDVGVYRVFNYDGILTDNGLALGSLPAGSSVTVQTSVSGQVNLVNSSGLTLDFWDGASGPKNDNIINGGDGIWQNSNGNDNWTDASGSVNAPYSDSSFAVFGGTAGTVTVDNSLGNVATSGMQFATSGYTITGDSILLDGPESTIRVGDGTAIGEEFVATVNADLYGNSKLVKTDAGTLVLSGTNSYTAGTVINGGTLQIGSDANLGSVTGSVTFNDGTLHTTADIISNREYVIAGTGSFRADANSSLILDGIISGGGSLTKSGEGTVVLTADNSGYTGATSVAAGTLAVNGILGGDISIGEAGRLTGTGSVGSTINNGTIAPGFDGAFGSLAINGDYVGNNGRVEIAAALGDDSSATSRLIVSGATSGTSYLDVINRDGLGGQTVEGIKIIEVNGSSDGEFILNGDYIFNGDDAVIAGAYGYRLYQGGVSTPTDGDWYLRSALLNEPDEPESPLYQPGVPVYEAYGSNLQALNGLPTMQQRIGNRSWAAGAHGEGIWGRMEATRNRANAKVSTSSSDQNIVDWKLQVGAESELAQTDKGERLVAGLTAHYGDADSHVRSIFGNGSINTMGYGVGATLTWYGLNGFYVDGQAQYSRYNSDLNSDVLGDLVRNNDGSGESFSIEIGKRSMIGTKLSITPQIQTVYSNVRFDKFIDPAGATVSDEKGASLKSRWGIALDHQSGLSNGRSKLYGLVNLNYEWLDGTRVQVSGTPVDYANDRLWGEIGLGGSINLNGGVTLYTEVSGSSPFKDMGNSYTLKANAGVRITF
ncbi:autotransporter-associated beta strand repeat-containing protein [Parasphingorhabdus sp. JC815]|uniref:autotransporter-associated beta strand repeat-containing protein n=1 Tax=Parasphingorhabdus sp. JC815 TaxID=3232140 RepID=UPI003458E8EE